VARETGLSLNAVFTAKSRVLRELRRLGQGFGDASEGLVSLVLSRPFTFMW
jgi:hypothetical protein